MKAKLKKEKVLKPSSFPRSVERKFQEAMLSLVKRISTLYANQTLGQLNKTDERKFADRKIGNYANVFETLSNRAKRKVFKRFSNKRLKGFVQQFLNQINGENAASIYTPVEDLLGIDRKQLMLKEALSPQFNALTNETLKWVTNLRDDILEKSSADILRGMAKGDSLDSLMSNYWDGNEKMKHRAKTIARTQVATYNSLATKMRAEKLGVTEAIWMTARDERVRPAGKVKNAPSNHRDREGKRFLLAKGCYSSKDGKWLLPGMDYNCRCTYRLILPGMDEENEI